MTDNNALINFGELSKPATVLIEKISDAIGAVFAPYQIKRIAAAETEAEKIRALAQIEITDIQQRALIRVIHEEGRKQENIENIIKGAIPNLDPTSTPEKIENDWLAHFFESCKIVSDPEMQIIWSRILAGEANTPGNYSKRTVRIISTLEKIDANFFTTLCRFGWKSGALMPMIFDCSEKIYTDAGINFGMLTHLEALGLIRFDNISSFHKKSTTQTVDLEYYGENFVATLPKNKHQLHLGEVILTATGIELSEICGATAVDGFIDYAKHKLLEKGIQLT